MKILDLIVSLLILFSVIATVIVLIINRRMKKLDYEIQNLQTQLENMESKPSEIFIERRNYHRINLDQLECRIEFKSFGIKRLGHLIGKSIIGVIDNISVGGIKFITKIDLPIQYHILAEISFQLKDEKFDLIGEFIRKESIIEHKEFIYGIQFKYLSKQDENRLGKIINQIELEKHSMKRLLEKH